MKMKFASSLFLVFTCSIGLFRSAGAQLLDAPTGPETGAAVVELIENLTDWLFFGFLLMASIFIILAAFQYVTKGGDPAQVSEAKRKLIYAAAAIIIATLSKGFVAVARSILGT